MLNDDVRFQFINKRYPHIGKKLVILWGQQGIEDYFSELLGDSRGGSRTGFPQDVVAALEALHITHLRLYAEAQAPPPLVPVAADTVDGNENFKIVNGRFPHIGKKLAELWGAYAFSLFINELFQDTREGTRKGFPKEVSVALFRLMQDHDRLFPEVVYQAQDIWSLNNKY